jgi:hypothetical protein
VLLHDEHDERSQGYGHGCQKYRHISIIAMARAFVIRAHTDVGVNRHEMIGGRCVLAS